MTTLNLEYAQDHLAELVEKAGNGESFVITKGGTPVAQLIAIDAPPLLRAVKAIDREEIISLFEGKDRSALVTESQSERPAVVKRTGFMRGQIKIPDDFDTMGSSEIERLFEFGE